MCTLGNKKKTDLISILYTELELCNRSSNSFGEYQIVHKSLQNRYKRELSNQLKNIINVVQQDLGIFTNWEEKL